MKRRSKKRRSATIRITNPRKAKRGGTRKGGLRGIFGALVNDAKDGALVLGGRYAADIGSNLGVRYLGSQVGQYAGTVGQLGAWFMLKKLVKGATGRLLRLGILSQAVHELAVAQGLDIPAMVTDMLPGGVAIGPTIPETETSGQSGIGLFSSNYGALTDDPYAID